MITNLSIYDSIERLTEQKPFFKHEDKKGHDTFLGARFPKEMARDVTLIKEKGPYEVNADVVRDAVWLGLQALHLRYEQDDYWKATMQLRRMALDAAWEAQEYEEDHTFVNTIQKFCQEGKRSRAVQYLSERLKYLSGERKQSLLDELDKRALSSLVKEATKRFDMADTEG